MSHNAGPCGSSVTPHEGYNAVDGRRYCCFCGVRLKLRRQDVESIDIAQLTNEVAARVVIARAALAQ